MKVNLNKKAISKTGPEMKVLGPLIQGNILKSHGRGHTAHIFLTFNKGAELAVRDFIKSLDVTSAEAQNEQKQQRDSIFTGFYLSQQGYNFLNIPDEDRPADFKSTIPRSMKNASLSDPVVEKWEKGFAGDIHAMVLLAWGNSSDNISNQSQRGPLGAETKRIINLVKAVAVVTAVEEGNGIKREGTNDDIEHFGYVDGISQPKFFVEDQPRKPSKWDAMMPLKLVLVDDPGDKEPNAFGSYLVFRKLEQNVKGFKSAENDLALNLNLTKKDIERAGAMVIGRFEDGTPVNRRAKDGLKNSGSFNNFNYNTDGSGAKCPYHAHIRKTNPRGETARLNKKIPLNNAVDSEKARMMARRGIIYGKREHHPNKEELQDMPEGGVGLLFMSFQSSLQEQFEFIQSQWANSELFLPGLINSKNPAGLDPVIGQGAFTPNIQKYAKVWDAPNTVVTSNVSFQEFVKMKGGEYFFAPSIPFLKSL